MAPGDQRRPVRRCAKGVELLDGKADHLAAVFRAAFAYEFGVICANVASNSTDFFVRRP